MKFPRKIRALLVIFLVLTGASACIWFALFSHAPETVPVPNGYDAFLEAANGIKGGRYTYGDLGPDEAIRFVAANEAALNQYRHALTYEYRIPIEYSGEWLSQSLQEIATLKRLIHTVVTEAKVAEEQGNSNRAFALYLDALRLAHRLPTGGMAMHYQAAAGHLQLVARPFGEFAPKLTPAQREEALVVLHQLENGTEPPKTIVLRDRAFLRATRKRSLKEIVSSMLRHRTFYPEVLGIKPALARRDAILNDLRQTLIDSGKDPLATFKHGGNPESPALAGAEP